MLPSATRIDDMMVNDLIEVAEIERKSFLNPWGLNGFVGEFLSRPSHRLVARDGRSGRVLGFAIFWMTDGEAHLNNLAVHPEFRGHGVADRLLVEVLDRARTSGAREVFLEVRPSNQGALRLYRKNGFHKLGVRRGYYGDNGEDAWVLGCKLDSGRAEGGQG